jgi:hypothetical protein
MLTVSGSFVLQISQQPTNAGVSGVAITKDLALSIDAPDAVQPGSSMLSSSVAAPEVDRPKTRL